MRQRRFIFLCVNSGSKTLICQTWDLLIMWAVFFVYASETFPILMSKKRLEICHLCAPFSFCSQRPLRSQIENVGLRSQNIDRRSQKKRCLRSRIQTLIWNIVFSRIQKKNILSEHCLGVEAIGGRDFRKKTDGFERVSFLCRRIHARWRTPSSYAHLWTIFAWLFDRFWTTFEEILDNV